jgi:hypothetical protein
VRMLWVFAGSGIDLVPVVVARHAMDRPGVLVSPLVHQAVTDGVVSCPGLAGSR